jgi:hypothetical protein
MSEQDWERFWTQAELQTAREALKPAEELELAQQEIERLRGELSKSTKEARTLRVKLFALDAANENAWSFNAKLLDALIEGRTFDGNEWEEESPF